MASSERRRKRDVTALGGIDAAVPPTPPVSTTTGGSEDESGAPAGTDVGGGEATGGESVGEQASKPVSDVDNEQASKPASTPAARKEPEAPAQDPEPQDTGEDAGGPSWGIEDLVGGINPEEDLKQTGLRVPRYVATALGLYAQLTGRDQYKIATEALKSQIPQDLQDLAHRQLYPKLHDD